MPELEVYIAETLVCVIYATFIDCQISQGSFKIFGDWHAFVLLAISSEVSQDFGLASQTGKLIWVKVILTLVGLFQNSNKPS